jgi:hypothetical protein
MTNDHPQSRTPLFPLGQTPTPAAAWFEVTPAQVLDRQCRCTAVDVATVIVSGRGWPASGKGVRWGLAV